MSKKMLKRSLALGALMAFVITGSAMAAEVTPATPNPNGNGVADTVEVLNLTENSVLGSGYEVANPTNEVIDTYIFNLNDKTLTVNGNITVGPTNVFDINGTMNSILNINGCLKYNGTVDVDVLNIKGGNLYTYGTNMVINTKTTNIEASGVHGINVQGSDTTSAANLTINSGSLTVKSGKRALRVAYGNTLQINTHNINIDSVQASGASHNGNLVLTANEGVVKSDFFAGEIEGNVVKKGNVNLTLGKDVELTGKIVTETTGTGEDASASNITLNGATWNVTGDSNITSLAGNGGKIELAEVADNQAGFAGLEIGNVTNSGVEISGAGLTEAVQSGKLTAEEALAKLSGSVTVDEGTATLALEEGDTVGKTTTTKDAEGKFGTVKQDVNTKAAKVSKAATNLKAHYRAHMNDMNKRMGELRMANGEAGVWTRMVRGESEYEGAKMQYNQYQLGYDEKLSVDKRWTVGAAVTFAEGDGSYGQGSTEDKSTAFAIYGSKLNNDGTFVDLIARYAHLESDMEDSVYGKGDYSTNGMSVSAEFGKRIQQGNGLWVEPQVELTYGTIDSANFRLKNGRDEYNANFDSMDSFIARVGFSIGKDIKQGNVYARASYLYDFDGETTSLITKNGQGTPTPEDFGGGWWEVGVGANINLSKATYIYADVEKTFGGEVDTNWQWNLGVRYSF